MDSDESSATSARSVTVRLTLLGIGLALAPILGMRLTSSASSIRVSRSTTAPSTMGATSVRVIHVFNGWTAPTVAGSMCAPASDVDGDGCPDLFLATRGNEEHGEGEIVLVSGRTGARLRSAAAQTDGTGPAALRAIGDFDRDGMQDLLVGIVVLDQDHSEIYGWLPMLELWVYSGRSALPMFEITSGRNPRAWFLFGSFEPVPDRTGDAKGEVLLATPGSVRILDGATGNQLDNVPDSRIGQDPAIVASGQDMNGDGTADFALGGDGEVRVLSGVDSKLLFTLKSSTAEISTRAVIPALVPDLDGDGVADVLVGYPQYTSTQAMTGLVRAFSGASGELLYAIEGTTLMANFGSSLVGVGDVDGDGLEDFAVSSPGAPLLPTAGGVFSVSTIGAVTVHSGLDGTVLTRMTATSPGTLFGAHLTRVGDLDGDGTRDLVIEEPRATGADATGSHWRGATWVLSGATLK